MNTITDRYVWAVTRSLPQQRRGDVAHELRTAIEEAVQGRVAAGADPVDAERGIIAEFGDPDRRAAEYAGRPAYLIGPAYFFDYRRLVVILLAVVTPSVFGGLLLAQALGGVSPLPALATALSVAVSAAVQVGFWTTVVFAIIERTAKAPRQTAGMWHPSSLPEVPKADRVTFVETILGMLGLLLFIGLIVWQRNIWVVQTAGDEPIPVLRTDLWDFWLPWFIALAVAEMVFLLVAFSIGHFTWLLAWINVGLNLAFAIPAVWLLREPGLVTEEFLDTFPPAAAVLPIVLQVLPWIVVLAAVLDTVDGFRRAWKATQPVPQLA